MNTHEACISLQRQRSSALISDAAKSPTENNTCNSESTSVRVRREIDEAIRNLTREIIRLKRLKEVV